MQIIRCTAKLRKEMGIKDSNLFCGEVTKGILGPWHANLIYINRRKCIIFVNDATLFNFIAPDVKRGEIRGLYNLFLSFLHPVLVQEGFSETQRGVLASEYAEVVYQPVEKAMFLGAGISVRHAKPSKPNRHRSKPCPGGILSVARNPVMMSNTRLSAGQNRRASRPAISLGVPYRYR